MKICKKTLFFLALFGSLFATCTKEEPSESISLKLNRTEIVFEADIEGESSFEIYSNAEWKVLPNKGWIAVSPDKGSGDATITVKAERNDDGVVRSGQIDILVGGGNLSVKA